MAAEAGSSELTDLRRRNLRRVAEVVRDRPGVHMGEVAARTGLAAGAVSSLVNSLVQLGILQDSSTNGSGRGRPRRTLALSDHHPDLIAARITRTGISMRNATLAGRTLAEASRSSTAGWGIDEAGQVLAELAEAVLERRPKGSRSPRAVISFPGAAIGENLGSTELDWTLLPLRRLLDPLRRLGITQSNIGNDGSLATLAESRAGVAKGRENAAVILLERGLGGSAIIDGKLLRGSRRAPGFGHTPVNPEGPICTCGLRGCIELYASLNSIAEKLGESYTLAGTPSAAYAAELGLRAQLGDNAVLQALGETRNRLRDFSDLLGALLAPEVVVLSGPAAALAPWLVSESAGMLGTEMVRGQFEEEASLVGAVLAAQDDALNDPLSFALAGEDGHV